MAISKTGSWTAEEKKQALTHLHIRKMHQPALDSSSALKIRCTLCSHFIPGIKLVEFKLVVDGSNPDQSHRYCPDCSDMVDHGYIVSLGMFAKD